MISLQDQAPFLGALAPRVLPQQGCAGSSLEHFTHTLVGAGRALQVFVGTDLLADLLALHEQISNLGLSIRRIEGD